MPISIAISRCLAAVLFLAIAGSAQALSFAPSVMLEVSGGSGATNVTANGTLVDYGDTADWTLNNAMSVGGIQINSWSASFKEDPFVNNNISVTNTTLATQTFIATVILPISPFAYDTVIFSSIGVTVTDSNGNGSMSFATNLATPIYQGQVNGILPANTLLSLTPPKVPISLADCLPFVNPGCSATDSTGVASLGVTPGLATSIAITLTFDLSPGDSAGITSRFEIVPEPGTGLLVSTGLLAMATQRRRRASIA